MATATKIVHEDDIRWNVECEADGCTNVITEPKRRGYPVDAKDPSRGVKWVTLTAPSARRCIDCGPF